MDLGMWARSAQRVVVELAFNSPTAADIWNTSAIPRSAGKQGMHAHTQRIWFLVGRSRMPERRWCGDGVGVHPPKAPSPHSQPFIPSCTPAPPSPKLLALDSSLIGPELMGVPLTSPNKVTNTFCSTRTANLTSVHCRCPASSNTALSMHAQLRFVCNTCRICACPFYV